MLTRREWLTLTAGASAAAVLERAQLLAQQRLVTRPIPSSGEQLPMVGLGSSATFAQVARAEDVAAIGAVFKAMIDGGQLGRLVRTTWLITDWFRTQSYYDNGGWLDLYLVQTAEWRRPTASPRSEPGGTDDHRERG